MLFRKNLSPAQHILLQKGVASCARFIEKMNIWLGQHLMLIGVPIDPRAARRNADHPQEEPGSRHCVVGRCILRLDPRLLPEFVNRSSFWTSIVWPFRT
jgi:hypothetical protein